MTEETEKSVLVQEAKQAFAFLVDEFGFNYFGPEGRYDRLGTYESADLRLEIFDEPRDGLSLPLTVKRDTYWINSRTGTGHKLYLSQLITYWDGIEVEQDKPTASKLRFYAERLRKYGASTLKGDLSACENVLIEWTMRFIRGISVKSYIALMRDRSKEFSQEEKDLLEALFVTESPVHIWLNLQTMGYDGRFHSRPFWEVANHLA